MKNKKRYTNRISILDSPPSDVNNKFMSESDIIVNSIIEKIISLSISGVLKNRIEKEIPIKSFTYLKDFISDKLKMEFLPHDSDDTQNNKNPNELSIHSNLFMPQNSSFLGKGPQNKSNSFLINKSGDFIDNNNSLYNIDQIFYNNCTSGENDWEIINEPKSNRYDSYASTMVKFIEIQKDEIPEPKKHKKGIKVNDLEAVKEEESFTKSNINKEKENEEENLNNKNDEDSKKNELSKKPQNQGFRRINLVAKNQVRKKRNDIDINQFPCEDIEKDDYYEENNKEIDYAKLRKELIEKEEAKLKDESKNNKKNKTIDIKQIIGENTNKQYYGKNITVDPNGQIVQIKAIKLNKLKQEFKYPKTILKNVKQPKKIVKKENKESKENKENKENANEQKIEVVIRKEDQINENNKEKEINNLIDQLMPVSNKSNEMKILPKISQKKLGLQIKTENNEPKKIKREPVFPSGSNFDLINLEIGVSIKEDEKFKTGGKDFFKKFNKYSKDIYNEKLKESIAANSFLNTKTQIFSEEMNKFKTESNLEHTYGGFNMTTVNQDISIQKDLNSKYLMTSTNNFGNYNYNYGNISNLINSNKNNNNLMNKTVAIGMNQSNTLNPSIKLSNISSLVGSLDKLSLITERQERLAKKNANLFKNQKKNNLKTLLINNKYNEMDKFTKEILKSRDISNRGGFKSQDKNNNFYSSRNPEKPSNLQLTRELGYRNRSIRNRSKITPSLDNPAIRTVAFFKQ